jgi:phosphoadenosine phosphosulfate reductase
MKPSREQLPELAAKMETWTPQEILAWAWETYGDKLTMSTALGAPGCAILAMLSEITKDIYVFNLETGYQFDETLELRDRMVAKYGVPIHLVKPESSVEEMEAQYGGPLYTHNTDLCCHIRKIVPLTQALEGFEAYITGIRREETAVRANAAIVEWDEKRGRVKINPLAAWNRSQLWSYLIDNDVPYNPLHDMGYPSIGCWPCTKAVKNGEDERSGRWSGSAKTECGLHLQTPVAPALK